ncbi:hypothetical protein ACSP9K_003239 [Citrobacter werkmanii]
MEEIDAADTVAGSIKDWSGIYSFFHKFKERDDFYIAEVLSGTILRMLDEHWNTAPQIISHQQYVIGDIQKKFARHLHSVRVDRTVRVIAMMPDETIK